uniref:OSJNBb0040D15.2 protein n=1 Tax=Oryza sativa subsp. japonica TaxID=39947 RepID=Q7XMX2_ORYSJ|nr:OSJNBb0040D15.2 [Oryza sativa Japonica Group]
MARGPLDLWNAWASQILVLHSLTLQVVLLVFAGIRRRECPGVLKFLLWLSYLLADSTAIYALGHLSIGSAAREHKLVAFWAPFLLLHLGGPDNITGYALQDNELWLRHLQILVVQVLRAGERTWALRCSNFGSIRNSLKELPGNQLRWYKGYLQNKDDTGTTKIIKKLRKEPTLWKLMELELSLMYDILYTKAAVIHTSIGYTIRTLSSIAIATSFLLFHFSGSKDNHRGVDIIVTYVLLGGALVMETTSLLSALGSSWALDFLCAMRWSWLRHAALCTGRWHRLRRMVLSLRRLITTMTAGYLNRSRGWSGTIGQLNLLSFRAAQINATDRCLRKLAMMLGIDEWWDSTCYSWIEEVPMEVKEGAVDMVSRNDLNTMGLLRHRWGEVALDKKHPGLLEELQGWRHGVDFHESIITWHIATDLILAERENKQPMDVMERTGGSDRAQRVHSIRALSNYMMFLLVTRPDMLPGLPQNWLYQRTCDNLDEIFKEHRGRLMSSKGKVNNRIFTVLSALLRGHNRIRPFGLKQTNEFAKILLMALKHMSGKFDPLVPRLTFAHQISQIVLNWKEADPEDVLFDLWTDFLIYAANRCNRESHAKKLNSGGHHWCLAYPYD